VEGTDLLDDTTFRLEGEEKRGYLQALDARLAALSRAEMPIGEELEGIRAFLEAVGQGDDSVTFYRLDSGFPDYFEVMKLLAEKGEALRRMEDLNEELRIGLLAPRGREPEGTLAERARRATETNAMYLAKTLERQLDEAAQGKRQSLDLEGLARRRKSALLYRELASGSYLVDAGLEEALGGSGTLSLSRTSGKRLDWSREQALLRLTIAGFDPASRLFLKHEVDIKVPRRKEREVLDSGAVSSQARRNLALLFGLSSQDAFLAASAHWNPVRSALYAIGPFYSGHSRRAEKIPESVLSHVIAGGTLLAASASTALSAEDAHSTHYMVPSPDIEGLPSLLKEEGISALVYTPWGETFASI